MSEQSEDLEARIAAYIDGELPEDQAARLEVFLANTDPALAEKVIGMLADKHRMMNLPREFAPPDLLTHVMEQVERSTLLHDDHHLTQPRRSWWQSRLATAAAAIIMVGGFGYLVVHTIVRPGSGGEWKPAKISQVEREKIQPAPTHAISDAMKSEPSKLETAKADGIASAEMKRGLSEKNLAVEGAAPSMTPAAPTLAPAAPAPITPAAAARADRMTKAGDLDKDLTLAKAGGEKHKAAEDVPSAAFDEKAETVLLNQLAVNQQVVQNGETQAKGFTSVESAAKALSTLSRHGSIATKNPIVVMLVARNDQDPANLRNTLQTFMEDPSVAQMQTPLIARYANPLNRATIDSNSYANNPTTQNAYGNNDTYTVYNKKSFEALDNGNLRLGNSGISSNGGISNTVGNNNGGTVTVTGTGNISQYAQVQRNDNGNFSTTYRVVLREDLLQKLTADYQVYALSCGSQAFIVDQEQQQQAAPAYAKSISPPASTIASGGAGGTAPAVHEQVYTKSAKTYEKPTAERRDASDVAANKDIQQQASVDRPRQLAAQSAQESQADKSPWIDCVIKMEPRPTRGNNAQLQLNTPAPNAAPNAAVQPQQSK